MPTKILGLLYDGKHITLADGVLRDTDDTRWRGGIKASSSQRFADFIKRFHRHCPHRLGQHGQDDGGEEKAHQNLSQVAYTLMTSALITCANVRWGASKA